MSEILDPDAVAAMAERLPIDYQQVRIPAAKVEYVETLYEHLADVAGMEPQPDDLGNVQAVYRLDHIDDNSGDLVLTFPAAVAVSDLKAAVQAFTPSPPAAPPPSFADILTGHLSGVDPETITATDPLSVALKAALEQARSLSP